jgi:hypothetical protein
MLMGVGDQSNVAPDALTTSPHLSRSSLRTPVKLSSLPPRNAGMAQIEEYPAQDGLLKRGVDFLVEPGDHFLRRTGGADHAEDQRCFDVRVTGFSHGRDIGKRLGPIWGRDGQRTNLPRSLSDFPAYALGRNVWTMR